MDFPLPTERQARILWMSLTALAIGVFLGLLGVLAVAVGWLLDRLSPVLLPLAIAGILAYLLEPLVDFFERKRIPRLRAILLVFVLATLLILLFLSTVVPPLVRQTGDLIEKLPDYALQVRKKLSDWAETPPLGLTVPDQWKRWLGVTNAPSSTNQAAATNGLSESGIGVDTNRVLATNKPSAMQGAGPLPTNGVASPALGLETTNNVAASKKPEPRSAIWATRMGEYVLSWSAKALPEVGAWMLQRLTRFLSGFSFFIGLALVPVYLFYFLLEKGPIERNWTEYLPIHESWAKEEVVFVLRSINNYLILFFRGQVLVALSDGVMLTVGFLLVGLNYGVVIGFVAGLLSLVPYLGITISLIPTLILAAVQFGDWWHPLLVVIVFSVAQSLEAYVVSPKIMGNQVGLHPVTIIIAVMIGTALLGGILGGVLAIPLTAALRVIMFRYVWKQHDR